MKKTLLAFVLVSVVCLVIGGLLGAIAPDPVTKTFDSGAVAVTDASNYVLVARIQAEGRPVLIQCDVGSGGAIAHLMVAQSVTQGATTQALATDSDFATATSAMPYVLGTNVYQTAAGGSFQVKLESGAADYCIYAKAASTATTVRVTGRSL